MPTPGARDLNTIWLEIEEKLGGWVRGQLVLMLAIGLTAGLGYAVIGLPNAALMAVAAALLEIVPMIGPVLAFAPAILVALAADPNRALVSLVHAVVSQQIERNVQVPRVMREAVGISPLPVLLGVLLGSALYGLPGAFLAVPDRRRRAGDSGTRTTGRSSGAAGGARQPAGPARAASTSRGTRATSAGGYLLTTTEVGRSMSDLEVR